MPGLWFEELHVGQVFRLPIRRTATETDNILFTAMTHNPAQLHLDEEYMRNTEYGRRLVNSVFTLGLMVGISVGDTTLGTAVTNLGWDEVRFPKPVFLGDIWHAETEWPRASVRTATQAAREMTLRSLLFIPGDSERKLGNADRAGADALTLDLEDSVSEDNKPRARSLVSEFLRGRPREQRKSRLWVRINLVDSPPSLADLTAVVAAAPDGLMLPKADGPLDVARLSHYLDALGLQAGIEIGSIRILPVATETAAAPFRLGEYATGDSSASWGLPGARRISRRRLARARTSTSPADGRSLTR